MRQATPVPWAVWVKAPIGYWIAWAAAVPATPKASPASVAPSMTLPRASASDPSTQARSSPSDKSVMARRANWSEERFLPTKTLSCVRSGVRGRRIAVKASIAWVMASAPAMAVRPGGQVSVRSGSQIAVTGMRCGLEMPTFSTRSVSERTATGVTSDPVPAVVGTAIRGRIGPGTSSSPK